MTQLTQDLRYALRTLRDRPGFTAVAILTLALGIGANSAIFSVVNGVLLAPLPYPAPQRLLTVWEDRRARDSRQEEWTGAATFEDWRRQNRTFEGMAAFLNWQADSTGAGEPERLPGAIVSAGYFDTLGVAPVRGRGFLPAEGVKGAPLVVVLADDLWRRRFGADPNLLGRTITLNGENHVVVGVLPPGFRPPMLRAEIYRPLQIAPAPADRGNFFLRVIGRLKPGVDIAAARADMGRVARGIAEQNPAEYRGVGVTLEPLHQTIAGPARPALLVLLAAVGLVLLIACANVANLLLARSSGRTREIAIRTALGASRARLIRQLLTESLLLAFAGGLCGLLIGVWGADLLRAAAPPGTPLLEQVGIDWKVLAFTLAASLATGLAFGLAPALQGSRPDLNPALKEGGRGAGTGTASRRLRGGLVVAEVAVALMLLAGAGLLIKSFAGLLAVDPGFRSERLLVANLVLPVASYKERPRVAAFYDTLLARLQANPAVQAAGAVSVVPLGGDDTDTSFVIDGRPRPARGDEPASWYRTATPGYFRALGLPVLRGRGFTAADSATSIPVVAINETMARRFFPGENPLGRRLRSLDSDAPWSTIVGVVGDVRHRGLAQRPESEIYIPQAQNPSRAMVLVLRAAAAPLALTAALRAEVRALDPNLPVAGVTTMEQMVAQSLAAPRFTAALLVAFALLALGLAAVGIYGVTAYAVAQQRHEIGVRVALGASSGEVVRYVVGRGMSPTLLGVVLGLLCAFGLTRALAALLVGVSPTDPATFIGVALLLAAVALAANYLPARRAAAIDPVEALRHE